MPARQVIISTQSRRQRGGTVAWKSFLPMDDHLYQASSYGQAAAIPKVGSNDLTTVCRQIPALLMRRAKGAGRGHKGGDLTYSWPNTICLITQRRRIAIDSNQLRPLYPQKGKNPGLVRLAWPHLSAKG